MASEFKRDKPYNLTASFENTNRVMLPEKTSSLEAYFNPYYLVGATLVLPYGFNYLAFGATSKISNLTNYIAPASIEPKIVGTPALKNAVDFINPKAFSSSLLGIDSHVFNFNKNIYPQTFTSSDFGYQGVYNLKQFIRHYGHESHSFGYNRLFGGRRWLYPYGFESSKFGRAATADQYANPTGVDSLGMGVPSVSPRILYPTGISSVSMGAGHDIRTPVLLPNGFASSKAGNPTAWFHTRPLAPLGILGFESGYLGIADPTQLVLAPSLIESAIFGDTAIKNKSIKVGVTSINDGSFSDYTAVTNQNRLLNAKGFASQSFSNNSIRNKTPSLFFESIEPPFASLPSVGYRIRSVIPTGFDRLLLGKPDLIKTPEITNAGIYAFNTGYARIDNYTRYVEPAGVDTLSVGGHRTWFRYRHVNTGGFDWSLVNEPTLTHGVREVIFSGFVQDDYGKQAWVSHGTRGVEPRSVFQEFSSNHMLGGHHTLYPSGFIATEFGTRVIPESTSIYTQGFIAGTPGLAQLEFKTRYIEPAGYHVIGSSFFDRWGKPHAYNQVQHISLYHQGDSGLAPPRWSDWQSIENRNKTIGAVGFSPIRFGYSQIDNNAAPLLTLGIAPPIGSRNDVSMISHAIRDIGIDGIEPPYIGTWGVAYNAARVTYPASNNYSSYGQPEVVNTRREYRNIGMIDSLASGAPMVSFKIRTIDIEPRYSIGPPQINLPTVDLWTRYVDLVGYQTGKYGFPYLDIKFNIIYPKYNHTEKTGYATLRNLTPELFINGHDSLEFGQASLRTQWRNVDINGYDATLMGLLRISDTKQSVSIRGWLDSGVGQKPEVIKNKTNPYVTQTIWLTSEAGNNVGNGFGFHTEEFGYPKLHQNTLYPQSIGDSSNFGGASLWSNTIKVVTGYAYDGISNNATISNINKAIFVKGIDNSVTVSELARLSPNYIKQLNTEDVGNSSSRFSSPLINLKNREVYPYSVVAVSKLGMPSLDLSLKVLFAAPIRPYSMGFPEIPNFKRQVDVLSGIDSTIDFGNTTVKRPPYTGPQYIIANGFLSSDLSSQYVQNFNRSVAAKGSDGLSMGSLKEGDEPFMWQGLRIGEHVPLIIGGGEFSYFGDTTIQLKVRQITLDGFNSFISDYDFTNFDKRMRVTGTTTSYVDDTSTDTKGFDSLMLGDVGISLGQHFIRPDGNSNQFRKGGYHA